MSDEIDDLIEEGDVTLSTARKYASPPAEDGIAAEDIAGLEAALQETVQNNRAQKAAVDAVAEKTKIQDDLMETGHGLIRKVQSAAKAEYGEDNAQRMKEFHVGGGSYTTVSGMKSELGYTHDVALKLKADLSAHGVKDATIASCLTTADALTAADTDQENAKKLQKVATKARDNAAQWLRKAIRRVRNSAKSVFAEKPEILIEFEPVAVKHSGKKDGEATAASTQTPQPAQQQTK